MLKRIPYSSNLIDIGNANHIAGAPVWSDGRVAYGRIRNGQTLALQIAKLAGGFWVNEEDIGWYKLCKESLNLTSKISANQGTLEVAYAYPFYAVEVPYQHSANSGYIADNEKYYKYSGGLIYLDNAGNSVVYDSSKIYFNSFGSLKRDNHGYAVEKADAIFYDENDNQEFSLNACAVAVNDDFTRMYFYSYDDDFTTVYAEYHNGYITSPDYTGAGTVNLSSELWLYEADTTIVDISMLESDSLLNPAYIFFKDGIIDTNINTLICDVNMACEDIRTAFQVTSYNELYAYVSSKTYDQNNLLMYYGNRLEIRDMYSNVLWRGAGIITEDTSNSKKYAYTVSQSGVITELARYENQTLTYNGNTYPNGDIVWAGNSSPYLTPKQYKIFIPGPGTSQTHVQGDPDNPLYPLGLTEDNYPAAVVINGIVTVSLSTFTATATIDGNSVTLTGDVFELSQFGSGQLCFPGGLHALIYKKYLYVINQTTKKIFKVSKTGAVQSASFNGIEKCNSLAYLIKRWNRRQSM